MKKISDFWRGYMQRWDADPVAALLEGLALWGIFAVLLYCVLALVSDLIVYGC